MEYSSTEYCLILQSVPDLRYDGVVAELMELFNTDSAHAAQIASDTPVILISRLTEQQAHNVRTHIVRLQHLGAEVDISSSPPQGAKSLSWPAIPPIAMRPGNVFVCPGCGERFAVSRLGAAPAASAGDPPQKQPEIPPEEEDEVIEAIVLEDDTAEAQVVEADLLDDEPVEAEVVEPEVVEAQAVMAEPADEQDTTAPDGQSPSPEGQEPPAGPAATEPGFYRVSIRQKLAEPQRQQAAELISTFQGIPHEEAFELAGKALIPVLKKASSEEAHACRDEFKAIGINVRIAAIPA